MPCPICGNPDAEIVKPELWAWIQSKSENFKKNTHKRIIALTVAVLAPFFSNLNLQREFELMRDPNAPKERCPKCNQMVYLLSGKICSNCLFGAPRERKPLFTKKVSEDLDKLFDTIYK